MLSAAARLDRARRADVIFMTRLSMRIGLRINGGDEKGKMCNL